MNRRTVVIVSILVLLPGITVAALAFFYFREPPAIRAYHDIHPGMTRAEVNAVIGRAPDNGRGRDPGNYHSRQSIRATGLPIEKLPFRSTIDIWDWNDGYRIELDIDNDTDKVVRTELIYDRKYTFVDALRRWLGW